MDDDDDGTQAAVGVRIYDYMKNAYAARQEVDRS
jgi:hypothetical protein